ncbi:SDR family NAD(P)-dependent oxidoreductase [Streptomyces sp. NBC_01231]|nr:SDR family NAD(P)-dependent oxidoreductase [Streptomyces sp. NBC_01231]
MTTTLITGANKGLGHETARQLIAAGHTVYVSARDAERGRPAAEQLGARFVLLDATVETAAKTIAADGGLDVLINNAGIASRADAHSVPTAETVTADQMRNTFETNVFGVVRVTHAFLPLLQRSAAPVVVNVTGGLASLTNLSDPEHPTHFYPGIAYPASKTAVNMLTVQQRPGTAGVQWNPIPPSTCRQYRAAASAARPTAASAGKEPSPSSATASPVPGHHKAPGP